MASDKCRWPLKLPRDKGQGPNVRETNLLADGETAGPSQAQPPDPAQATALVVPDEVRKDLAAVRVHHDNPQKVNADPFEKSGERREGVLTPNQPFGVLEAERLAGNRLAPTFELLAFDLVFAFSKQGAKTKRHGPFRRNVSLNLAHPGVLGLEFCQSGPPKGRNLDDQLPRLMERVHGNQAQLAPQVLLGFFLPAHFVHN